MGSAGSTPDATREDIRSLFMQEDRPATPISASEAAERLECPSRTARRGLEELAERGELLTKQIDDSIRVWWAAEKDHSAGPGERLQPKDEEYSALVSAVKDYAIFMLDPEGTIVSWNDGAERIKGYSADEIIGEHFSAFYTDDAIAEDDPEKNLEIAAAEGRIEDEGWRVRKDGSRFWANVAITAIHDEDGELQGFTKVTRDMTERREHEQQLRRERDLTRQILETAPVSICLLDADGKFIRANQRMFDRLGIQESELSEYSVESWDILDAEGDPVSIDERPWTRILETGESVYDFRCQVDLPGEGHRWLSLNAALVEDEQTEDKRVVITIDDVTDQKERERQLRRESDQTEKLLRTAPIAIAVHNAEGETVMANQRAQEFLGLSEQEFIEKPEDADEWEIYDENGDVLDPDETPSARILATGEPIFEEELVIEPPSGELMHFSVNAAPVFGPDRAVERVITAGEDITELKRRERQLEQRKTELETELGEILGRISDAFYAFDDAWRFTHLNDHAAEIMQQTKEELLGREVWEVFPDAIGGVYWEELQRAMDTQTPVSFEVYEEGIDTWLEFNAYPSESGLSIYFRDITERKERERQLEESERRYRTLIEHFPNGAVTMVDENLHYQTVGGTPLDVTGVTADEIENRPVLDVLPQVLAEELIPKYEAALEGETRESQVELEGRVYQFQIVPVRDDSGDIFAALGMSQDITERREYERKLEESNDRLEQFAYAASHDLQEPLRMVSSYLQLIEGRYEDQLDEDGQEFLDFAVAGAERMRDMIDGLLEYSRVETQGVPFKPVSLEEVISNVRDDLQIPIEESNAEITVEPLPNVQGDRSQLRQVFQNLLSNAIEYSGDGPPRIDISAERDGEEWKVSVRDRGIGIDPNDADRIFQVFQRLHSHEDHPGTGIGLALCKRIIERHGGDIWVDSEPGEGSTFYISIPASND